MQFALFIGLKHETNFRNASIQRESAKNWLTSTQLWRADGRARTPLIRISIRLQQQF